MWEFQCVLSVSLSHSLFCFPFTNNYVTAVFSIGLTWCSLYTRLSRFKCSHEWWIPFDEVTGSERKMWNRRMNTHTNTHLLTAFYWFELERDRETESESDRVKWRSARDAIEWERIDLAPGARAIYSYFGIFIGKHQRKQLMMCQYNLLDPLDGISLRITCFIFLCMSFGRLKSIIFPCNKSGRRV